MTRKLVILRGVSGSGKSTRAKEIKKEAAAKHEVCYVCSADDYFMRDGKYEFDAKLLSQAHAWCKGKAEAVMYLAAADVVVVDNTNTQHWEYKPYIEMAQEHGYEVEVIKVGQLDESNLKAYANRNRHGVSLDVIRKQAKRFEK